MRQGLDFDRDNNSSSMQIAAVVGGMALGMLISRMIPVFASARGSMRARSGADPFERLIEDHRRILETLDQMERHGSASLARRAPLFLTLKRTLAKHALAEEDVIYPMLHDEARETEKTKHLYDEHADIKIHLFELEKMLKSGEDWTHRVRALRQLIAEHAREEEEIEFPKVRALLDEKRRRSVSGLVRREEAMIL
jgi:hemerythrin superfamily protein